MLKFVVLSGLGIAFASSAVAQPSISSISIRPDGNTEQTLTTPVQNQDGSTGTSTTITIRDPNGQSVETDKQGHITKISLKDNCETSTPAQTAYTFVCYPVNGNLVKFEVTYLLYSCHPPDSNVMTMQRRFAVEFKNLNIPCDPQSYALDVQNAQRYGENYPNYSPPNDGGGTRTGGNTTGGGSGSTQQGANQPGTTQSGGSQTGATQTGDAKTDNTSGGSSTGTGGGGTRTTGGHPKKPATARQSNPAGVSQSTQQDAAGAAATAIGIGVGVGLGLGLGGRGMGDRDR